ncbi:Uncharacterised protein [Vibrio cholerae]|nr:Uncharacterised protein [Vibrio cholerae]
MRQHTDRKTNQRTNIPCVRAIGSRHEDLLMHTT